MNLYLRSLFLTVSVLLLWAGCSRKYYRNAADREAAKAIAQKTPQVPNMDPRFTIAQETNIVLGDLPSVTQTNASFGGEAGVELGAKVISLEEALEMAVKHSRTYQNRKEQLFLQALDLTLARYRYTPIFSAGAGATYHTQAVDVEKEIETIIGTEVVRQQRVVLEQQHELSGRGDVGVNWFLATGGRLAADFSTDFLRFMTGDPRWVTSSRLGATLTQPLLRGAGFKVALENLTQAERNLLYDLRDFALFRKEFSVQIAAAYYQVLQARDEVRNAWVGLQNFRQNVERERAFVEEARIAETALGRLRQAELSTEGQWVDAVRNYREGLDQFKILLGLPVDAKIVPDEQELQKLAIVHPNIALEDSVRIALETRLDLYNQRDQFEDAARRIDVAANGLKPDLTLILQGDVAGKPGLRPQALDFERGRWSAGLDLDLPLDRKAERNSYRASLIAYERTRRELELAVDQIKLDVNQGWRALDQARRNYDIAEVGVTLSRRRVEEQELRMEIGREGTTALDLIDARRDLINALNQRTSALVRHTIARLQFWRDLGILYIKENGQWEEANNAAR
ncbi:MAG: TolC family protein [Verrucomicrobiales bacterium]|nr:TolC family protein [Verrucomicrobiales bacterium]